MKKYLLTFLFLTGSLFAELDWAPSYKEGLAQAKKENKIIMLMFSIKECRMCNYMKKTVYEDEAVSEYIENFFVSVEVDIEAHPDKYGYDVFGTPTYYFLDSNGTPIGRSMVGGADPEGFLKKLQEVRHGK